MLQDIRVTRELKSKTADEYIEALYLPKNTLLWIASEITAILKSSTSKMQLSLLRLSGGISNIIH